MTLIFVLIVVALLVAVAMWVLGTARRSSPHPDDVPDREKLTDDAVAPPAHPDRPVPGSQADRDRKGHAGEPTGSAPVRDWSSDTPSTPKGWGDATGGRPG